MALYCKNCKCSVIIPARFCPVCGTKLIEVEYENKSQAAYLSQSASAIENEASRAHNLGVSAEFDMMTDQRTLSTTRETDSTMIKDARNYDVQSENIDDLMLTALEGAKARAAKHTNTNSDAFDEYSANMKNENCSFNFEKEDPFERNAMSSGLAGSYRTDMNNYGNTKGGIRFNFSKPLSLLLAMLMLATFFFPWMKANAAFNDIHLLSDREVNIFQIPSFVKDCTESALKVAGQGANLTQEGKELIGFLNVLLMLQTLLFLIIAMHFVLFGVIGLFSGGKARYYFARVGGTLYFISLLIFIGMVLAGNSALGSIARETTASGAIKIELSIAPMLYVYIFALLALLFRVVGVRVLRRLNVESCLNRGNFDVAKREIKHLRSKELLARLPQSHDGKQNSRIDPEEYYQ